MSYIGDFRLGDTFDTKFCTVTTTGAPTTLAGSPVISAYVGNSTTELTAGITLSVDFDSRTGMHNVRVVATSGNGYATASNYQLVLTAGTVGGTSVVGYVVAEFSIENRSALMPTTAARTLDVTTTGGAGIDWANVEAPTTTLNLSGTTIKTATDVATATTAIQADTDDIQTRLPAALVSGRIDASVGAMAANVLTATAINADAITAAKIATNAIDADAIAADAVTEIQAGLATPTNITAGIITTVTNLTNAPTAGDFTATMKTSIGTAVAASAVASVTGNVGGNVNGNVVGSVGSVTGNVGGNVTGSVGSVVGAVGSVTGAVGSVTGNVGGNVVGSVGSVTGLTAANLDATVSSRATPAQVTTQVTGVVQATLPDTIPADGTAPSMQSALYMLSQFLFERSVTSTTVTVNKPDGTTALFTLTLNDATTPTAITRAT